MSGLRRPFPHVAPRLGREEVAEEDTGHEQLAQAGGAHERVTELRASLTLYEQAQQMNASREDAEERQRRQPDKCHKTPAATVEQGHPAVPKQAQSEAPVKQHLAVRELPRIGRRAPAQQNEDPDERSISASGLHMPRGGAEPRCARFDVLVCHRTSTAYHAYERQAAGAWLGSGLAKGNDGFLHGFPSG